MEIFAVETGNFKLDGGAMFGVVPKVMWQKLYPADENNLCNWAMRCLLVVDNDRKILIDNGIGDKQDEKFLKNYYLNGDDNLEKSLSKLGFKTDDITDVVLTHLHFDHCGGSIKYNEKNELVPAFTNATFHTSKQQWEWATKPNRREKASFLKENILPIIESGKLNLFDTEHELFPNFYVKLYNGHTDGQVIPVINVNGQKFAYTADLFPSTAHLPMPFIMSYDTKPLVTLEDRERFFKDAIKENYILFFEHDLYNECCTLHETEKGIRAKETFTLNDFFKRN
ncbi:MAG: MBL fold metallo-hydrolase [Bacteroidales bacterium]|nr:MBL fold metallo-hydrolase [Bacteroidales bacterium]MBN2756607.1 MBL fold metallo-hydrolase [Bacteroidales bacterium]